MSINFHKWAIVTVGWLLVLVGLGWTVWQQQEQLNLSATAGGQYPYLKYATGIAQQGASSFVGDRNRMPIVPAIISLAYDDNPKTFFDRAKRLAIFTSLFALVLVGVLAYRWLPILPATALTLTAAICIFLDKASFVQAELLYYSLSCTAWLLLCKLLTKPTVGVASLAGAALGISYLTKSSTLPLFIAYLAISLGHITFVWVTSWSEQHTSLRSLQQARTWTRIRCLGIVTALFLIIVGPYLQTNNQRYGHYFYNVNSTFFFWCDDWDQAQAFANKYQIDQQYPQAPDVDIPSASHYWRTHTSTQIIHRFGYGLRTLADLAWHSSYAKYLIALTVFTLSLALTNRKYVMAIIRSHQLAAIYSIVTIIGYLTAYAWYVPVAYGDRFLRSLLLPVMFIGWWLTVSLDRHPSNNVLAKAPLSATNLFASLIILALMLQGIFVSTADAQHPTPNFVRFYYNESREAQLAGNLDEAIRGYQGVLKLDSTFASAHRELGMMALMRGAFEQAIGHLQSALALKPNDADLYNSLGSAILQTGRATEALALFKQAVQLDPGHAVAWYNLGGTYLQLGNSKQAKLVAEKLSLISPKQASQLRQLIKNIQP